MMDGLSTLKYLTLALLRALLVANLVNGKKAEKWLKLWQMGTHLIGLSKGRQMNTNMAGFKRFSKISAFLCV